VELRHVPRARVNLDTRGLFKIVGDGPSVLGQRVDAEDLAASWYETISALGAGNSSPAVAHVGRSSQERLEFLG
jgi:hypothetical protein